MKYLSLFSGIGGFELGIGSKGKCVGFSELDYEIIKGKNQKIYAKEIYKKHFPKHKDFGDITKIKEKELPDFDLLVGGFPCQTFSIAGKRKGFKDTRGTLFFDIARILKEKKPKLFLLENVKGLLSHDSGRTFYVIVSTLDELGYDLQWQVLNSKDFGVPQNRERVFIVGHLRGKSRPKVFPFGSDDCISDETNESKKAQSQTQLATTIRTKEGTRADNNFVIGTLRTYKDGNGFRELKSGLSPTLQVRAREDGSGQPVVFDMKATKGSTRRGKISQKGYSKTLDQDCNQAIVQGGVRRLTPTECERLQGFPDSWTAGISDTQRYKCLGNAVTVNVVKAIIDRVF